jgi:hypothetical protein
MDMILQFDSCEAAATYLRAAVESIDKVFGEGHAKKHPDLVAAFLATAAADFHSCKVTAEAKGVTGALSEIAGSISEVGEAISKVAKEIRDLEITR